MSNNPELIANLSLVEKRALLTQLLQKRANQTVYPLSAGQQSMWLLHQLAPESAVYNVMLAWRISSDLDISVLQQAFQKLVDRHSSLRTTYSADNGKPVQHIHQYQQVHFQVNDAASWSQEELNTHLVEAAHRPFDLEQGTVLRVDLFTRSVADNILLLTIHHIAVDMWSLSVLLSELGVLYTAIKTGQEPSLSSVSWQYTDYVHWQTQMLASFAGEKLGSYWNKQLSGELPVLNLPTDRPRSLIQTYHGASHAFYLDEKQTQQLKILARNEKTTLYAVLLATFQVLLYRYTDQEDILVACPTVGRSQPELAEIVGYFANPVVLRANLAGNPTLKEFLAQVRQTLLGAIDHQDYPFPLLVNQLLQNRDSGRSPITDVMFVLEKPHRFELDRLAQTEQQGGLSSLGMQLDLGGLVLESYPLEWRVARCDLDLLMIEAGQTLSGSIQYNTDLFEADTIARMVGHFQTLLQSIIGNPDQQLQNLPLLTETERDQYLGEWNDTKKYYSQEKYIHQLFEEQVEQTPDAVAIVCKDQQLSYRELNQQANQLAHHLQALGVGTEVRVGICVERSPEIVIGLLAILKAGGAYVPLDPEYPQERLAFILEDAQISVLLTQRQLIEQLPKHSADVVFLDTDWRAKLQNSQDNLTCKLQPEHLAYMVYTSGTIGKPKAVMAEHRNLLNYILATQDQFSFNSQDVMPCLASFAFSISLFELLTPLVAGGTIMILTRPNVLDLNQLLNNLEHITCIHSTPSLMRQITDFIEQQNWKNNKYENISRIFIGGDLVAPDLLEKMKRVFSYSPIYILYGCSEVSTLCSSYRVPNSDKIEKCIIGKPLNNVSLRLCDQHQNLVPIGVLGEIYVGGAGVTRGYANRQELTREKYVLIDQHIFYKTGDRGRYLPDGNIEFIGRIDYQVNLRGFRIELGEIEAVLNQHPMVRENVVIASEEIQGDQHLIAYVILDQEDMCTSNDLRHFIQQQLPEYMIPSAFVFLSALPLTPNGKLDRRHLESLKVLRLELEAVYAAPQTEVERTIATVWQEVLHLEKVGVHDNFFDLGGHSLLVIEVHSKLQKVIEQSVSITDLFKYPTISCLSKYLSHEKSPKTSVNNFHDRIKKQEEARNRKKVTYKEKKKFQ